jgi:hypothetical protein
MFPDLWKEKGGESKPKGKPKDKDLLKVRSDSKATSFGDVLNLFPLGYLFNFVYLKYENNPKEKV